MLLLKSMFEFVSLYYKEYKILILVIILLNIVISIINLIFPYFSGYFIDEIMNNGNYSFIFRFIIMYCIFTIVFILSNITVNYLNTKLNTIIGYKINKDVIQHIQQLPQKTIEKLNVSELTQRINNDANSVAIFCLSTTYTLIINLFILIVILVVLYNINHILCLFLTIISILYTMSSYTLKEKIKNTNHELKQKQTYFFGKLYEQLDYVSFLKIHSLSKYFIERLNTTFESVLSSIIKYQKVSNNIFICERLLWLLSNLFIFGLGGYFILNNQLSIGIFTIVVSYFSILLSSCKFFFDFGQRIQEAVVSYQRIVEILKMEKQINGDIVLNHIENIKIENLSFRYDEENIFNKLNIEFKKGNIYVLKGNNGTGKSTLLNLILGTYVEDTKESIKYNDISMININMQDLRKQKISFLNQMPQLLTGSMIYNLSFNQYEYDIKKIKYLFELFSISKYLQDDIHDIYSYSGGEIQKIALIRTLLKEFDCLILDEPTSALDKKSKINFIKYLNNIKKNKIIIIASHEKEFLNENYNIIDLDKIT